MDVEDSRTATSESLLIESNAAVCSQEGIVLAEDGNWIELLVRLNTDPTLAQQKDHYGMNPLHWACTENVVPPNVIQALIDAYPEALFTKNNACMLPLHIAIRARTTATTLKLLCNGYLGSIGVKTGYEKLPLQLAREVELNEDGMEVLQSAQLEYERAENLDLLGNEDQVEDDGGDDEVALASVVNEQRFTFSLSKSKEKQRVKERAKKLPPMGLDSQNCAVCGAKCKKAFKKKIKCYSCEVTLCKEHVGGRVDVPDHFTKKPVCARCLPSFTLLGPSKGFSRVSSLSALPYRQPQNNQLGSLSIVERPSMQKRSSLPASAFATKKLDEHSSSLALPTLDDFLRKSDGYETESLTETDVSERPISSASLSSCTDDTHAHLLARIQALEEAKGQAEKQLHEQNQMHAETMLLLTQTMTRVAALEMKLVGKVGEEDSDLDGTLTDPDNSEGDVSEDDFTVESNAPTHARVHR